MGFFNPSFLQSATPTQMEHPTHTRTQRLLTSLRESIVDKPPFISGTLQIPDSYFSLFYKLTKDGLAARFGDPLTLSACR
jgi:hypothetical protein